ncbi:phosphotransferase enzyme family protein [Reyranella sp.]|uniref:phosphotransferase enzyme family protein n=2 Tax=Reyranella sp. TaxID=1929291 RepID=UPI003D13860D
MIEAEQAYAPAARQALAAFGVVPAELAFVNMSENVTFRVTDARDGAPLVLRLHRPWYHDIEELKSEHLWTRALVDAGVAAPKPLLTTAGESFAQVDIPATGERRWAGLARWVDGELLDHVVARETDPAATLRYFSQLGALMAAMHDQASGWTPPAGFRRHALDADGLLGPAPFWGPFWDHPIFSADERSLLMKTRDRLHAALVRYGKPARTFSLIHADLHPRNVVVDGSHAAVIDFDDAGFGWHQYDLAVALVSYQDGEAFAAIRDACIAGYRSMRAITDQDLALLPMFLLIREMAQIGWYGQRPELPRSSSLARLRERVCRIAARFEPVC